MPGSPVLRGERLPRWARPSLVVREGRSLKFPDFGRLLEGDRVYIFVSDRYPSLLDRLFTSRMELDPEDAEFFGAFAVDPGRPAADLDTAYGVGLSQAELKSTIGEVLLARLGGWAEYGDRLTLGPIELIVRDIDEKGRVTGIGLSFEPTEPQPLVPRLLGSGNLRALVEAVFGKLPDKPAKQDVHDIG